MTIKRVSLVILSLTVALLPFLGCASIVKGSQQDVYFSSDPEGAKITVFDGNGSVVSEGTSPTTLPLKRGAGYFTSAKYRVVFSAPGYGKREVWITGNLEAGWYLAGNFLIGGLIGWLIVDPLTGAMWHLSPDQLSPRLEKDLAAGQSEGLHIVLADQIPEGILLQAERLPRKL